MAEQVALHFECLFLAFSLIAIRKIKRDFHDLLLNNQFSSR